ncbi:Uncharacterized protein APZ42_033850 [Daphnia magna]|uniref:Rhabdovirus nucleocapsid domain-containing protein n=1 Tax=Daphnia magna TaxID=35525 RepID=A0A164KMI7_9CRUS|nr:Uncharacterized protein APZ42_033850 [Daphnia magna]
MLANSASPIDPNIINRYLWNWAKGLKATSSLPVKWKSYNLVIAKAGEEISPEALVVEQTDLTAPGTLQTAGIVISGEEQTTLAIALLGAHKYSMSSHDSYRSTILDKFKQIWASFQPRRPLDAVVEAGAGWSAHSEFRKIVAAIDMFLAAAQQTRFTSVRVATLGSRYLQCSGLMSLQYLWNILGWDNDCLVGFMWDTKLVEDVIQLLENGQEYDCLNSYLPYLMDFGLVVKSAYAAASVPRFTIFCHAIGSRPLNTAPTVLQSLTSSANQNCPWLECDARKAKHERTIAAAQYTGWVAASHLKLPQCTKLQAFGQTAVVLNSPCCWTNGFINFNDKPYAFCNNTLKRVEANMVLPEQTLAHSCRYDDTFNDENEVTNQDVMDTWIERDTDACSIIYYNIEPTYQTSIEGSATSAEMWNRLAQEYAQVAVANLSQLTAKFFQYLMDPESVTQDYKEVKRLLQERFHGNENQDFFQTQLEEVKRHSGEAILDYGFRLKNIFEHGYPKGEDDTKTDETTRFQMLRQNFFQGLDKALRNKVRYKPFTTYEALVAETNKYALLLDREKEEKDQREFINAVENNSTSIEILKAIEKLPEAINSLTTGTRYPQKVPE